MVMRYKGSAQDNAIIDNITNRIQQGLADWYGASSQLVSERPEIQSYTNSFLLRYEMKTSAAAQAVLVKIRRSPKMDSLHRAVAAREIHANIPGEYDSMQLVREKIGDSHTNFTAIRPLAFYEEYHAIVMEEFPSRSLRQLLEKPQTQDEKRNRLQVVKETAHKAGQLLRFFHDNVQSTTECRYSMEEVVKQVEFYTTQLEHYSSGWVTRSSLIDRFQQKLADREIRSIPFTGVHQDLTCDNVLYAKNGKVCLIDIKTAPGPIYSDLALLLIHPETFRSQIFRGGFHFPASLLQSYRKAILDGYFARDVADPFFVNVFCALRVLDKWTMHAELLHRYKGLKRVVTRPLIPIVNRYFDDLLARYLNAATLYKPIY